MAPVPQITVTDAESIVPNAGSGNEDAADTETVMLRARRYLDNFALMAKDDLPQPDTETLKEYADAAARDADASFPDNSHTPR